MEVVGVKTEILKRTEMVNLIKESKGKIFTVKFRRRNPKCLPCNKGYKPEKLGDRMVCPKCGAKLSEIRTMRGRLGVKNPGKGITKPGQGQVDRLGGTSQRLNVYKLLTVYDVATSTDRSDGKNGGYRCIPIEGIFYLASQYHEYKIVD